MYRLALLVITALVIVACTTSQTATPSRPLPFNDAIRTALPPNKTVTVADAIYAVLAVSAKSADGSVVMPAGTITVLELVMTAMPPGSTITMFDLMGAMQTVGAAVSPQPSATPKP